MRLYDEDLLPVLKFKDAESEIQQRSNSSINIDKYLERSSYSRSFRESLTSMFQITEEQQPTGRRNHRNVELPNSGKSGALASGDENSLEASNGNNGNLYDSKAFTVSDDAQEVNIVGVVQDQDQIENPIPMLNLQHPENIMTWFYCQRLFTRYGERTRARLEFNILLLVAFVFILMAGVIGYLASSGNDMYLGISVFYK